MAKSSASAYVRAMSSATALYTRDILRWAASLPVEDGLVEPHGSAERRSPSCGSLVRADVMLLEDRVTRAAFAVQACALGQASAAMLLARAAGLDLEEARSARTALAEGLAGTRDWPGHWEELSLLADARDYPGRHAALLLGYDALIAAMEDAERVDPR